MKAFGLALVSITLASALAADPIAPPANAAAVPPANAAAAAVPPTVPTDIGVVQTAAGARANPGPQIPAMVNAGVPPNAAAAANPANPAAPAKPETTPPPQQQQPAMHAQAAPARPPVNGIMPSPTPTPTPTPTPNVNDIQPSLGNPSNSTITFANASDEGSKSHSASADNEIQAKDDSKSGSKAKASGKVKSNAKRAAEASTGLVIAAAVLGLTVAMAAM